MRSSNAIYKYFVKVGDVAKCRLCNKQFSCKQSSTGSLWRHLDKIHNEEYKKLEPEKEARAANKVNDIKSHKNSPYMESYLISRELFLYLSKISELQLGNKDQHFASANFFTYKCHPNSLSYRAFFM
jgi:hypothetical protein